MASSRIRKAAPLVVTTTISFQAYSSQWLFRSIEPGPLEPGDFYTFNALVACALLCYFRTCFTDPGRIPSTWHENLLPSSQSTAQEPQRQRWCRKCEAYKPPRAHHCKTCRRCIVKMDHHCVWTANCISHVTFPHFVRFLVYSVIAMTYLETMLWQRCAVLWNKRHLPSYLGPSAFELCHLFSLVIVNSLLLFAMSLLLARTMWSLLFNTTTIEGWEIERHEALLRRARVLGGFLHAPDGQRVRIERQEFPWDVGIWTNVCQGMGSWFPLVWAWPLASSPRVETGLSFPHNEIEDPRKPWPPPDPDRMYRTHRPEAFMGYGFTQSMDVPSFRARQAADRGRSVNAQGEYVVRRRPFHERLEAMQKGSAERGRDSNDGDVSSEYDSEPEPEDEDDQRQRKLHSTRRAEDDEERRGEEAWRSSEGERLADFGVDEAVEFYDEDDVPLAELMRRRRGD